MVKLTCPHPSQTVRCTPTERTTMVCWCSHGLPIHLDNMFLTGLLLAFGRQFRPAAL